MGSLLGFHGPLFSEEEAWLPGWLQQPNGTSFGEAIIDTNSCFQKRLEEFGFLQENVKAGNIASLLSKKEGTSKGFQLFLSADSSLPISSAPSTGKVVDIHLHLSTDSSLENMPSLTRDTSERETPILNLILEESVAPEMDYNKVNADQNTSISSVTPTFGGRKPDNDSEWKKDEEVDRLSEADDIRSAVELSIAASEAMEVHEVIKNMSLSKSLSSSAILEVALQLKQARSEVLEETTQCSTGHSNEDEILLELDDLSMTDAYDDVGLSLTEVGDLDSESFDVSHSKGVIASDSDRHDENSKYEDNVVPETDSCKHSSVDKKAEDVSESKMLMKKDSTLKSCAGDQENTFPRDQVLSLDANSFASHMKFKFAMTEEDLSEVAVRSPHINISEDAGKGCEVLTTNADRFKSRWFGGWTLKEVQYSAPAENNHKTVRNPFVHETSFLSESADVAPDENSVVQKQGTEPIFTSQSSNPSQSCYTKPNDELLFSQIIMKSPSLSLIDPLCSVVPCSISSENGYATSAVNYDCGVLTQKCLKPTTENAIENDYVQRASDSQNMVLSGEELAVPDSMDDLHPAINRKFTSLRSYSMLFPGERNFINKDGNCDKSLPIGSIASNVTCSREEQTNCDGISKSEADMPVDMRKNKTSPLILNRRTRHRLQAFSVLTHTFCGAEVPTWTSVPGRDRELQSGKSTHEVLSNCEPQIVSPVPARKRVRFSETEAKASLENKHQKQPAPTTCDNRRAAKKVRRGNPRSESRAQEPIKHPKHRHEKHGKSLLLQNMEFLLTGFSCKKEKEIENLILMHGGVVLSDIPYPPTSRVKRNSSIKSKPLPIVLCTNKKQTIKFLYGCAVHAHMLKVNWLTDSITARSMLPPQQYTILQKNVVRRHSRIRKPANYDGYPSIFDGVGIMLLGKNSFCTGMAKVVKHGGGRICKTLQWLVQSLDTRKISLGVTVAEEESRTSRHLAQCAFEQNIPVLPAYWIIKSLHRGKLLPYKKNKNPASLPPIKPPDCPDSVELSMEI